MRSDNQNFQSPEDQVSLREIPSSLVGLNPELFIVASRLGCRVTRRQVDAPGNVRSRIRLYAAAVKVKIYPMMRFPCVTSAASS
jgi:hypothetical protein